MPTRIRRASDGDERPDNLVALVDQGFFAGHRAIGQQEVMQVVWVYEHAIDFDGLKRFHQSDVHPVTVVAISARDGAADRAA